MPRIGEFYGILIYMYYRDHLPPHIHALYAGREAKVEIVGGDVMDGELPRGARRLVKRWVRAHRGELLDNWERARTGRDLTPIVPME